MNTILNLTQHTATEDQRAAGLVDLPERERSALTRLLTFDALPSADDVRDRAERIAGGWDVENEHFTTHTYAMIGGAPYLMSALENALITRGITPLYAFSVRESVEQVQPDGSVRKINTFKHAGWVQI